MNDLKFATGRLRKNPGFTTMTLLALGIGANTAARRSSKVDPIVALSTNEAF